MVATVAGHVAKALVHGVLGGEIIGEQDNMFIYTKGPCRFFVGTSDFNDAVVVHVTVKLHEPERMPLTPAMEGHFAATRGYIGHFQLDLTDDGVSYVELKTGYITEKFEAADFIRTCQLLEEDFLSEVQSALEAVA